MVAAPLGAGSQSSGAQVGKGMWQHGAKETLGILPLKDSNLSYPGQPVPQDAVKDPPQVIAVSEPQSFPSSSPRVFLILSAFPPQTLTPILPTKTWPLPPH